MPYFLNRYKDDKKWDMKPKQAMGIREKMLKTALVGCGTVAQLYYAPALKELEKQGAISLRSIFDPDIEAAAGIKRSFPSASILSNLAQIKESGAEFAIIASPAKFHAEQAVELLGAGISVLCEKPLALTSDDAQSMIAKAASAKAKLAVGLFRRFFPAVTAIKAMLASGALGPAVNFAFSEGGRFSWPVSTASLFKKDLGGGLLFDIGPHVLDLIHFWFAEPVSIDYADDAMGGVEANCAITMGWASGLTGTVRLSRDCPLDNGYIIRCQRGRIYWLPNEASQVRIEFDKVNFAFHSTVGGMLPMNLAANCPPKTYQQCFIDQIIDIIEAIASNREPRLSGIEALPSIAMIERCYKNRKLISMGWLTDQEIAAAEKLALQKNSYLDRIAGKSKPLC